MTCLSTISRSALLLSQRVTFSPSSSRSRAFVAENTFTPVNMRRTPPRGPPPACLYGMRPEGVSKAGDSLVARAGVHGHPPGKQLGGGRGRSLERQERRGGSFHSGDPAHGSPAAPCAHQPRGGGGSRPVLHELQRHAHRAGPRAGAPEWLLPHADGLPHPDAGGAAEGSRLRAATGLRLTAPVVSTRDAGPC